MFVPDRLSLRTLSLDFVRSMRSSDRGQRDWFALGVIFGLPIVAGVIVACSGVVVVAPTAFIPAVALLAGVLLAAAGQTITLRARLADSLTLNAGKRVTGMVRETMSGLLVSAVAALLDALILGALASMMPVGYRLNFWHHALSVLATVVTVFLVLMFVATARHIYATYLEVFEGGTPLPRHPSVDLDSTEGPVHRIGEPPEHKWTDS
ncbi:hypothetical protein [Rhodococcus sp. IEGM1428]|uniref:hypothetical protein n=1 Tax=Rhodococcus sp. IEGM1428 TaxID=3392191 RepID=UPI003D0B0363